MTQFTVGCDPEFFVQSRKASKVYDKLPPGLTTDQYLAVMKKMEIQGDDGGDIVPICGLMGGTKDNPLQVAEMAPGYKVQEDGIAAEFNIPPCQTAFEFGTSLSAMLSHIEMNILRPKNLQRSYVNNLTLKKEWIDKYPNINVIGCDPDFCAYEEKDGLPVERALDVSVINGVRGAGGHVHLGYPTDMCRPEVLTKLLDVVLGLQFLNNDKQGARRAWWGLAGLYRAKSYGVEYRTMSNWWIWKTSSAKLVAGNALALLESLAGHLIEWSAAYNAIDWQQVKRIIDAEDGPAASALFLRYMKMFPVLSTVVTVGHEKANWLPPVDPVPARRPNRPMRAGAQIEMPRNWNQFVEHRNNLVGGGNVAPPERAEDDQVE